MATQRATFAIYGLTCGGGGALTAERALAKAPGVARVYVNALTEMAYLEYDPTITDPERLVTAVQQVGLRAGEPRRR